MATQGHLTWFVSVCLAVSLLLHGCGGGGGDTPQDGSYQLQLINLTRAPLARCMDGTPAGYYWKPASSKNASTSWILHFQGGGECASEELCNKKVNTNLGSSSHMPPKHLFNTLLANDDPKINPDFHDWHMVYMPYCSQDLWSGRRVKANASTFGFYFSGHHIVKAILDALEENPPALSGNQEYSLARASQIVVTGDSAGGFGAMLNVDAIASRYLSAHTVAAPIAGIEFYAWPYTGPGHTSSHLADFSVSGMARNIALWDNEISPACRAAHPNDPGACIAVCAAPPYGWTFIQSPLFLVEAQSDKVVLLDHDWFPDAPWTTPEQSQYLKDFHSNETKCFESVFSPNSENVGIFNPACYIHTLFTDAIKIADRSYRDAFADFFFKRGGATKLQDTCGELCNPTCKLDSNDQTYEIRIV